MRTCALLLVLVACTAPEPEDPMADAETQCLDVLDDPGRVVTATMGQVVEYRTEQRDSVYLTTGRVDAGGARHTFVCLVAFDTVVSRWRVAGLRVYPQGSRP